MHILVVLLVAVVLYHLQCSVYRHKCYKNLHIDLKFSSDHAYCGDNLSLFEVIRNEKLLPLPFLKVKFATSRNLVFYDKQNTNVSDNFYRDDLVSMLMYQQLTRNLKFLCAHRGYYSISQIDLVCSDLFLSCNFAIKRPIRQHLYVYPKQLEDSTIEIPFKKMMGTLLTKRFYNEDPFEFAGIREYQPYDNMKNINWKASAKTGSLKVNVHDYTSTQQVCIFLNLEAQTLLFHEELMEESISLAATYAAALIASGIPVSLYSNGLDLLSKEPVLVTSGSTSDHMQKINEGLSRIETKLTPPAFLGFIQPIITENLGQDYYIFISTYQKEEFQHYLMQLQLEHQDFTWIVPLDKDIQDEVCDSLRKNTYIYQIQENIRQQGTLPVSDITQ